MIQARELRIGNLVEKSLKSGNGRANNATLNTTDLLHIYLGDGSFNYASIPLTEEWLLKFGFEKKESTTCNLWHIGINQITHDYLFDLTWLINPELINAPNAPFYRNGGHIIYYVHQLQNLYFALTNEELTIKP